eukprot:8873620-Alexandrium_andersonii.AAC.1
MPPLRAEMLELMCMDSINTLPASRHAQKPSAYQSHVPHPDTEAAQAPTRACLQTHGAQRIRIEP